MFMKRNIFTYSNEEWDAALTIDDNIYLGEWPHLNRVLVYR